MENYYFDTASPNVSLNIALQLTEIMLRSDKPLKELVILCIGTDRSTGDSLGPIVGYKLAKKCSVSGIHVYGTLKAPVHATNLEYTLASIRRLHNEPYIIAVDASLGSRNHVGFVTLGNGPLRPGLGVNKRLPDVGDMHITGIVNVSGSKDPTLLQTTRLNVVMQLADVIVQGIADCLLTARGESLSYPFLSSPVYALSQKYQGTKGLAAKSASV